MHDRLYKRAMETNAEHHNNQVDLLKSKVNLPLKPWEEAVIAPDMSNSWTQNKTHLAKSKVSHEDLLDEENQPVLVVECDDALLSVWRLLRAATALPGYGPQGRNKESPIAEL